MHVLFGVGLMVASFWAAHHFPSANFGNLFHLGSFLLLLFAPLGAAFVAYGFRTMGVTVWLTGRALFGKRKSAGDLARTRLLDDLYTFGRAVRAGRANEAGDVLLRTEEPLLRETGPLAMQRIPGREVSETVGTLAYARIANVRAAEDVLKTLSKAAPSFGMVGTIMGLVDVLTNLKDFDKLGPGMALAITTTLYGLALAQGVYVPLAAAVGEMGQRTAVAAELLGRGLAAIADGRSIYELKVLAGHASAEDATPRGEEKAA